MAGAGFAVDRPVQVLNRGKSGMMVFAPACARAEPGDTMPFVPTDKGHTVESVTEILPEGVERFKGQMNDEFTLAGTKPGFAVSRAHRIPRWGEWV